MLLSALRAKGVGEAGLGTFGNIGLDGLPVLVFGPDLLAESANRKQTAEHPNFTRLTAHAVNKRGESHEDGHSYPGVDQRILQSPRRLPKKGEAKVREWHQQAKTDSPPDPAQPRGQNDGNQERDRE